MRQEQEGKKVNALRYTEYYDRQHILDDLYQRSLENSDFTHLMEIIEHPDNIMLAFRNIKSNKGSRTAGVDHRTIEYFADMPQGKFIRMIQDKLRNYNPKPVRRVEIPKPNGKTRPLGIPCMVDRIIQQCILQVLEPICEAKFYEESYGFRPFRSAKNAVASLQNRLWISNTHFIVDVDIKGFFDNVDHKILRRQLWSMGIRDTRLLAIIGRILKAPIILPDGSKTIPKKGTPQGGILSPLLANVVLNDLDWWVHYQWQGKVDHLCNPPKKYFNTEGRRILGYEYKTLRSSRLKEMYIIRYADDFKICCRTRKDAQKILYAVTNWLRNRLHLEVSPEKTKVTNVRRHYTEFLGIKLRVMGKGKRARIRSHMTEKAVDSAVNKIGSRIRDTQLCGSEKELKEKVRQFNYTVNGLHEYYDMATCAGGDFSEIQRRANHLGKGVLKGLKSHGEIKEDWIKRKHGKSAQLRWLAGLPIIPTGNVVYKYPIKKNKSVNKYTPDGRDLVHDNLKLDSSALSWLRMNPDPYETVDWNDNRLSLLAGQYGKCRITGSDLEPGNITCVRKIPKHLGGNASYGNLVMVRADAADLLRSADLNQARAIVISFHIDDEHLSLVNRLRNLIGLNKV